VHEQAEDSHSPPSSVSLLHRWFIQYNPLYLVSAALVLYGLTSLSSGLASEIHRGGGLLAQLGLTATAELYGWALVGSAALLVRIRLRRPALMLALLAAAFQCDLTLHCPTAAHLGPWGIVASLAWLASGIGRFFVLAWAMQLHMSRSARWLPVIGMSVMASLPHLLRDVATHHRPEVVAVVVFALLAAGLWTRRRVDLRVALDPWPMLVARRARLAVWLGWAVMLVVHASFWIRPLASPSELGVALPLGLLLATRFMGRERFVWVAVGVALWITASSFAPWLWVVAAMSAVTLALRAWHQPTSIALVQAVGLSDPYRTAVEDEPAEPTPPLAFVVASVEARARLIPGVLACLYVASWTFGWDGGAAPPHVWWIELTAVVGAWFLARRAAAPLCAIVPAATLLHWIVVDRLIPMPASESGRALLAIAGGFALLGLSLLASVRFRRRHVV
jgi:hypothetical protein